jgi:membrane protein
LLTFAFGSFLFSQILSKAWERLADYALLTAVAFLLVLLLNAYVCPHRVKLKTFLPGTMITVISRIGAVIGFSVYLKISNMSRLYGALSTIIVFLLWLYILMICFIVGVIFNSEKVMLFRKNKNKRKKP